MDSKVIIGYNSESRSHGYTEARLTPEYALLTNACLNLRSSSIIVHEAHPTIEEQAKNITRAKDFYCILCSKCFM